MYRAVTYCSLKNGIVDDEQAVIDMTKKLDLHLEFDDGLTRVFVDGDEITEGIRSPEVTSKVSEVSVFPGVRAELVKFRNLSAKREVS